VWQGTPSASSSLKSAKAIVEEYKDDVITCPTSPEEWTPIGEVFRDRWNVSHAMEALGSKHVVIRKPAKSSSLYYNYNGFFSVVLMAPVNEDCKFLWVDISGYESMSDA